MGDIMVGITMYTANPLGRFKYIFWNPGNDYNVAG